MTESEQIDLLLKQTKEIGFASFSRDNTEEESQALRKAVAFGLLYERSQNSYKLTEKGYQCLEQNGFDNWQTNIQKREADIHQATLATANATIDAALSAKYSKNAAWVSGAISAISVALTFYQVWKGNELEVKLNAVIKHSAITDSLLKIRPQIQIIKPDSVQSQKNTRSMLK